MKLGNRAVTRCAPAKVNLRLEILGKRADGYHEIRSIMCPVGLYDEVTVRPAPEGIAVAANHADIPLDSRNLAYRAAELFMQHTRLPAGVAILLNKRIPVGAGLGGGSSDAAAVLLLLNELAGAGFPQADLMALGASLGSDIPFFCRSGPALAAGRGEQISPIRVSPSFWVVLVMPSFSISTAWAYGEYRHTGEKPLYHLEKDVDLAALGPKVMSNDLEGAVGKHFPEIRAIKEALIRYSAWGALMSGSGSTVFGIFFDEELALKAQHCLQADYAERGWEVVAVPALL